MGLLISCIENRKSDDSETGKPVAKPPQTLTEDDIIYEVVAPISNSLHHRI